jgi:hypothetical protein
MANHRHLVAGGLVANIAGAWDFIVRTVQFKMTSIVERYELHCREIEVRRAHAMRSSQKSWA